MTHIWTAREDSILIAMAATGRSSGAVAAVVGLSRRQVQARAKALGKRFSYQLTRYSQAELDLLRACTERGMTLDEALPLFPGRSASSLSSAARNYYVRFAPSARAQSVWHAWTPERIALLRELRAQGFSMAQCARAMGTTKGAACSVWARLRHKGALAAAVRVEVPRRDPVDWGAKRAAEIAEEPEAPWGKTIAELEPGHCRWPVGQKGSQLAFCGCSAAKGVSYCAPHMAMRLERGASRAV